MKLMLSNYIKFIFPFLLLCVAFQFVTASKIVNDSTETIQLNKLALKFQDQQPDSVVYYGEKALKLATRAKQYYLLNDLHKITGYSYFQLKNYKKAQYHLQFSTQDSALNITDRYKIYDALVISSEYNRDYPRAYFYLKNLEQLKLEINNEKHENALLNVKSQLMLSEKIRDDEKTENIKLLQLTTEKEEQLKTIFIASEVVLLIVIGLLCFLIYHNNKKFKTALKETQNEIETIKNKHGKLTDEMSGYEQLQTEIETEKRKPIVQENVVETPVIQPATVETNPSLIDLFWDASEETKKNMLPKLQLFLQKIPQELQNIELGFARHDWQMINTTLQTIKPLVNSVGLHRSEMLINEINEHVKSNATNRAVIKLLQVKASCTKAIVAIEKLVK